MLTIQHNDNPQSKKSGRLSLRRENQKEMVLSRISNKSPLSFSLRLLMRQLRD